ncbi:MAG: hypothetical protein IJ716_14550 [Lachnospiraceae bacterium]|nr:hypothetical protein [Lachnospiraceae bacterium]
MEGNTMEILTNNEEVIEAAAEAVANNVPKAKGCFGKTLIGVGIGFIAGYATRSLVIPAIKKVKERKAKYIQVAEGEQAETDVDGEAEVLDEE